MAITDLVPALSAQAIGRADVAELLALAAVSQEHALVVGAPGESKSMLARILARLVDGASYYETLLSETSDPSQVLGPYDLGALSRNEYARATAGYGADVSVLFLDEVGRASPAVQNALLHLLGPERLVQCGRQQIQAPLVCAIGAANSWPDDAASLDRWLLRLAIPPLPLVQTRALWDWQAPVVAPVCSLSDLQAASQAARTLPLSPMSRTTLDAIVDALADAGIRVSPRRFRLARHVAGAAAVLAGHPDITVRDLAALRYCLWTAPEQAEQAGAIILKHADPTAARLDSILAEISDVTAAATDTASTMEALAKAESLEKEAASLLATGNGRAKTVHDYVRTERVKLVARQTGLSPELAAQLLASAG